jgi:hypothetical protein
MSISPAVCRAKNPNNIKNHVGKALIISVPLCSHFAIGPAVEKMHKAPALIHSVDLLIFI